MIANCGLLGLDWMRTSLSAYMETLEAHNDANDPDAGKGAPVSDWLRKRVNG